jgi:DNA polymerase (family 10)
MDPRRVAHILSRISSLLELSGVDRFRARAYRGAADAVRSLTTDDVTPFFRSGELASLPGVGPATLSVIEEVIETGESTYLNRLLETIPEGLAEVARVPGLTAAKAALLHRELGVESLDDLEAAAMDGRLATVRGFGEKTVKRVRRGIEVVRGRSGRLRYKPALIEAQRSAQQIQSHPDVVRVEPAGELRRIANVVNDIVLVAECSGDANHVMREIADGAGVLESERVGAAMHIRFVDDTQIQLVCASATAFAFELWRATGNAEHVAAVLAHARSRGIEVSASELRDKRGATISITSEADIYDAFGMQFVVPELREGSGEVEAATRGALPELLRREDIRGVLHCHSAYSDGSVPIAEMAAAARERGWDYLGISDHSQAAFYAGGLKPDDVRKQHDEIDRLNSQFTDFRILKGIECDILGDGELDYDKSLRGTFEYVIGSVHSRFSMDRETMTARVLAAMDDPTMTILAHPTGRLLLEREPYDLDLDAVIEKAASNGVAIELNADPARLDLDWRWCRTAHQRGVLIEIGPDAHSPRGLDHTWFGVLLARKAWLSAADVLNTRSAAEILEIASSRH